MSSQPTTDNKSTLEDFRKSFKGEIYTEEQNQVEYQKRLDRFYSRTTPEETGKPQYIVGPKNDKDVALAIKFAQSLEGKHGFALVSGGHWTGRNCCQGVLIDLNLNMNKVEIIDQSQTKSRKAFSIQGGATAADVDRVGMEENLATITANDCRNGVVATTLAGGYGFLIGEHGLGVDNVIELDLVLADGRMITVNDKKHTDLFWAARGAGPAFGCVTRLVMEAHQQERQVCIGKLQFNIDNSERINQVARAVSEVTKSMGRKEAAVLVLSRPDVAQPVQVNVHTFYNGKENEAQQKFESIINAGPNRQEFGMVNYEDANKMLNNYAPHNHSGPNPCLVQTGAIASGFNDQNLKSVVESFQQFTEGNEDFKTSAIMIDLYPDLTQLKSAMSQVKSAIKGDSDMCFNGRTRIHPVNILLQHNKQENTTQAQSQARAISELFQKNDPSPKDLIKEPRYAAYTPNLSGKECFGKNYARLQKLKAEYDPKNDFNRWISVEPASQGMA